MKIVQINSVCGVTGTGRIVADLYDSTVGAGHECLIAYGEHKYHNQPGTREHVEIGTMNDCRWHALMTRFFDAQGLCSKQATKKLLEVLKEFQPDVIHLHNLHGYYINIEMLFAFLKESRIPTIWTLHDCWALTGHCVHFLEAGCEKWKTECHSCPLKKQYPGCVGFDRSKRNYRIKMEAFTGVENMTLVVPSHWLESHVKNSFLKEYPVKVVYNGIDLGVFQPTPSDFRTRYHLEEKFLVLGVANIWVERKGLSTFYEIADALGQEYQVVLVGLSREQIEELPENIIGFPRTDTPAQLAEFYTAADVFVHPGREETFGLTVAESIACNTWPIVYAGTACEEVVKQSCGTVVQGETRALIDAIQECRENGLPTDIRKTASCFSKTVFADNMLQIYNETVISGIRR